MARAAGADSASAHPRFDARGTGRCATPTPRARELPWCVAPLLTFRNRFQVGPDPIRTERRPMLPRASLGHASLWTTCACLVGCSVPIAGGLDDAEANRVVVALDRARVHASKEPDPTA